MRAFDGKDLAIPDDALTFKDPESRSQTECQLDLDLYLRALTHLSTDQINTAIEQSCATPGVLIAAVEAMLIASQQTPTDVNPSKDDVRPIIDSLRDRGAFLPPRAVAVQGSLLIKIQNLAMTDDDLASIFGDQFTKSVACQLFIALADDQLRLTMLHDVHPEKQKRANMGPLATQFISSIITSQADIVSPLQVSTPNLKMPVFAAIIHLGDFVDYKLGKQCVLTLQENVHMRRQYLWRSSSSFIVWFIGKTKFDLARAFLRENSKIPDDAYTWAKRISTIWTNNLGHLDFFVDDFHIRATSGVSERSFIFICWDQFLFEQAVSDMIQVLTDRLNIGLQPKVLAKFKVTKLDTHTPIFDSLLS